MSEKSNVQNVSAPGAEAFFTICSKNFLAHARVLHNSVRPYYPSARFFVVLCDRVDGFFEPSQEPFEFVYLEELELPSLNDMAKRYNITEFNTAVKPFAFSRLMDKYGFNSVIYLDPDLLFVDKMQELDTMLLEGTEAVLTPHILQPAEHDEVHDGKMLLFGVYNLGFLALRNTPSVRAFLSWWGRRLERDCVIRLDQGLFVDQKWADLLPAFVPGTRVIHHPGYNVAYWNLPQRKITRKGNQWFANGQPLRFVHFSGNKIDDPSIFSRHSQQVTIDSIGDLRHLLNFYREQVFSQGHQLYRKLPYAYSWDGDAGVNLHTPKSLDMAASENNSGSVPLRSELTVQLVKAKNRILTRINVVRRALPLARRLSGGWLPFAKRAWGAYRRQGWGYVKIKAIKLSGFQSPTTLAPIPNMREEGASPTTADQSHARRMEISNEPDGGKGLLNRVRFYWKLARVASRMAGGWAALGYKVLHVLRRGGFAAIGKRVYLVKSYAEVIPDPSTITASSLRVSTTNLPEWMPCLLFIDWSTPRPDRDAGSLTAYHLLKIYVDLGYNVTFIPSDLQFLGEYTEAIRALGVRCLHREDIGSVRDHLQSEGTSYKFVLLCRAPIAALYVADIRKFAHDAKIILNTSDLHYLRDIREAEIDGAMDKIEAAQRVKERELDIMRNCDVTIVMSSFEQEILKSELPSVDVRLIPLMFVETPQDCPSFEDRKDFLFIGGFPHSPNVDAVVYFCKDIFPLVRNSLPNIKFHIIGNAPPSQVFKLADLPGVIVHGHIKDVSTMFRSCKLSVAPLRYGAGIKGKIGTSLSYGVPVVATSVAVEGMSVETGEHVLVADKPQQFADAIVSIYKSKEIWTQLSEKGRDRMLQIYSPTAGHRRISALMRDINPQHKQIDLFTLRSFHEYDSLRHVICGDIRERTVVERSLIKHDQPNFFIKGFCATCGCESTFNTSFMYSYESTEDGKPIPNWREHLDCVSCGLTNRIRAAMHVFYGRLKPSADAAIYITEQTTPLFRWLRKRHPNLTGSEYFGDAVPFGAEKAGLRNEDLTALTFANESFDYILSFDVLEHVSDDIAVLHEVYRCLKPGGTFLFAAPFAKDRAEKLVRARMLPDGTIEHILPPEYHGNPVDPENGALCFRYFAWYLIDDMKAAGFEDPKVLHYWSRDFAYLGGEQFMFVATKPQLASVSMLRT